jgi:hypothetical protein
MSEEKERVVHIETRVRVLIGVQQGNRIKQRFMMENDPNGQILEHTEEDYTRFYEDVENYIHSLQEQIDQARTEKERGNLSLPTLPGEENNREERTARSYIPRALRRG